MSPSDAAPAAAPASSSLLSSLSSIALPTILLQVSLFLPFTLSAMHLGSFSSTAASYHAPFAAADGLPSLAAELLSAFSLSNLVGAVSVVMLMVGSLSALDTLGPQAYSLNPSSLPALSLRGLLLTGSLLSLLLLTWFVPAAGGSSPSLLPGEPPLPLTGELLLALRQPPPTVSLACQYLRTYALSLPPLLLFNVLQRFLTCQKTVKPLLLPSLFSSCALHPLLLSLLAALPASPPPYSSNDPAAAEAALLEVASHVLRRTALCHVLTNLSQCLLSFLHVFLARPHDPRTAEAFRGDPGALLRQALDPASLATYVKLAVPGVLSMSEWLYWEVVCFAVGTLGVSAFAVHAVPYSLIPLMFMLPLGLSIALGVEIGHCLGAGDADRLHRTVRLGLLLQLGISGAAILLLYLAGGAVVSLFTADPDIAAGCAEIWPWVCVFLLGDGFFGVQSGVLRGLGLQFQMAVAVVASLWCFGAPLIFYVGVAGEAGSVLRVWRLMAVPYVALNALMWLVYARADAGKISEAIIEREKREGLPVSYERVGTDEEGAEEEEEEEEEWEGDWGAGRGGEVELGVIN
ncbi:hypothetical protein TeGR_g8368 [Tetraparma gracilis]|uniref:Uncharacterized protein n=1 Tax=Tetraparma gracilis TaxID=2962635 RepID=A0ABQ6NBP7_9STRA|nr:hypothetical protein TeGR_g8368 [Tetraparma gracilis]